MDSPTTVTPYAEVWETHTGVVFLAADRAYKLKKPVDFGFCDFTSRETRERVCRREVELNRRLAPDVYLGVGQLDQPDGRDPEPLVVMRRMPAAARLSTQVQDGHAGRDEIRAIARRIATFHDTCQRGPAIDAAATAEALSARWAANIAELRALPSRPFEDSDLATVHRLAQDYLQGRGRLLSARIAGGHILDGHGDLLTDDVFLLPDGPRILDCLEFDEQLRYVDAIDDIAFLAMDLERLDAADLAGELLAAYREFTADRAPESLVQHYLAYRALVRAKVSWIRYLQGDLSAAAPARHLAGICRRHLQAGQVRLILVGGLPGTGKSTLAAAVGADLGAAVISSDRVRKERAGLDPDLPAPPDATAGLYSPEHVRATYREILDRAAALNSRGESAVLDATWSSRAHRCAAHSCAERTSTRLDALRCSVAADVAASRIVARRHAGAGSSDATPAVAATLRAQADPWFGAHTIDTSGDLAESTKLAIDALLNGPPQFAGGQRTAIPDVQGGHIHDGSDQPSRTNGPATRGGPSSVGALSP